MSESIPWTVTLTDGDGQRTVELKPESESLPEETVLELLDEHWLNETADDQLAEIVRRHGNIAQLKRQLQEIKEGDDAR